eukprot:236691-Chlamydomonas_euryale.AAC.1
MEPPESDVEELLLVLLLAVMVVTWEHRREEAMAAVLNAVRLSPHRFRIYRSEWYEGVLPCMSAQSRKNALDRCMNGHACMRV